jgi:hypothetical protein
MEAALASLNSKSVDFLDKVKTANHIFVDQTILFPGRTQFLLDWLCGSLLKIGKFDDSNL